MSLFCLPVRLSSELAAASTGTSWTKLSTLLFLSILLIIGSFLECLKSNSGLILQVDPLAHVTGHFIFSLAQVGSDLTDLNLKICWISALENANYSTPFRRCDFHLRAN